MGSRGGMRTIESTPRGDPMYKDAVTFDFWYTLVYLTPAAQDRFLDRQVEVAVQALDEAPPARGFSRRASTSLRTAFVHEVERAAAAASGGRTISCAAQLERAGRVTGRAPDAVRYMSNLENLVARTPFRAIPRALDTVRVLREAGYAIGLVSNTVGEPGRALRRTLLTLGFGSLIDHYSFSDELPWAKPNPKIFLDVLRGLHSSPSRAIHVGDGWSDVEGARRAHLRGGILLTGHPPYSDRYRHYSLGASGESPKSETRAQDLDDVPALVEQLFSSRHSSGARPRP